MEEADDDDKEFEEELINNNEVNLIPINNEEIEIDDQRREIYTDGRGQRREAVVTESEENYNASEENMNIGPPSESEKEMDTGSTNLKQRRVARVMENISMSYNEEADEVIEKILTPIGKFPKKVAFEDRGGRTSENSLRRNMEVMDCVGLALEPCDFAFLTQERGDGQMLQ